MATAPDYFTPNLAIAVESLAVSELDDLPFGVIKLDPQGVVVVYNATEAIQSGSLGMPILGKLFFVDVAPCMDTESFKGRVDRAIQAGSLDLSFSFVGDFSDRGREFHVRVQSARDGGIWIFHHRPCHV